jgi:hypothetical protein
MRLIGLPVVLVGAAFAVAAGTANATLCYVVLDAQQAIVYRDPLPPVDMSDRGAAERDALRSKGYFLMFLDVGRCVSRGFGSGWVTAGDTPLAASMSNTRAITSTEQGAVARAPRIEPARATAATPAAPAAPKRARGAPAN